MARIGAMTRRALFLLGWMLCAAGGTVWAQEGAGWKAAAASAKITPKEPMWMAGYASRTTPSDGVTQDLYAKALVLEDGQGGRFVTLTMDLIGIPSSLRSTVVEALRKQHQLSPERVFMNCSHTHCGPEFRVGRSLYLEVMDHGDERGAQYGAWLAEELVRLTGDAIGRLAPAKLSATHARCGFAMNRRQPTRLGFKNSPYPDGPVDHSVPVLEVRGAEGEKLMAVMFGYACHNTTLSFQQFCGDYAGYAQEYLEAAHPGAVALFVMGCGGDQNPYPRGKLELAQQHGRTLANAVETALTVTQKQPVGGTVKAALGTVALPFAPPPSKADLEKMAGSTNRWEAAHATMQLKKLEAEGKLASSYDYPVQVVKLGADFTLVALAGEVVVDYALRLKKEMPKQATVWVAGYSNDVMGYIPSRRVLEEGGYEAGGAMLYTAHPGPWKPEVEELIMGKVHELHRQLAE
jgi:neutral ceramidase